MVIEDHVETEQARALRSARQHMAAPGGRHDRLIAFLARALPMGVGVLAALMIITPLSPRGEVSFLLDRNKVAVIDERLAVANAMYRGQDDQGRPFSLQAGQAVQRSSSEGVVRMYDLIARILLAEGPARLSAESGAYTIESEVMRVFGPVRLTAADGYRMVARDVSIDLRSKRMTGDGGVEGEIPAGTFSADRLAADLSERTITLDGNARLRMVPGQLRMPQ
ncbi:LPS export ABC transporter periplasmic protein LptC [Altererythrobacter sp. H2]|uniref:LPS export ABC transporter periplasmic protein LptC n=1 Tax=Altererythrobacter sp. H2 TaxID=3108391 RepID=UPI000BD653D0|nr:LPS export ABC transporter periplasmic protein LptC [Altererythrobacter sp. H2]OZA93807.1 MAG: LPS export ABC transporter periplasmic protein LptC [Erythrobacter sp. 34-65-8]WRK96116.1 LPS export ABC transporter periplasmic protein LptC [Altererythrobacter sp. H2]